MYGWLATAVDDPGGPVLPETFTLKQNYPNPFNPSTRIGFTLHTASEVTLEVFNSSGRKVATLHEGSLPAGDHAVNWDASGFSSGVYFYRLTTAAGTQARKMLLLK